VASDHFRHWLAGELFSRDGEAASRNRVNDLVDTYAAEGLFQAREYRVHLRTAQEGGTIWLDLADPEGRAVRINKDGWLVVPASEIPVKFFRPPRKKQIPGHAASGVNWTA
jgi:hypothetical protein